MNAEVQAAFDLLNVAPSVTLQELEAAYKDLAQVWHPDRFQHNPRLQAKAQRQFCIIREAYETAKAFVESGGSNYSNFDHHSRGPQQEKPISTPTLLDLIVPLKDWFLASNVGAGPLSIFVAWVVGSAILILMAVYLYIGWNLFDWTGPRLGFREAPVILTIVLVTTSMARLAMTVHTVVGYWVVRFANLISFGGALFFAYTYQMDLVKAAQDRIRRQHEDLILFERKEVGPLWFYLLLIVIAIIPVVTWVRNPLADWVRRRELWLPFSNKPPQWIEKKFPLAFTIAIVSCLALFYIANGFTIAY